MELPPTSGMNLRTAFVLLLVAAVTALFVAVAWPFLKPLLLGALLAGLFHPLYRWITRLLGGRQSLGAAVTLVVLLVLGLGPISAFFGIVVQQGLTVSDQAIPWLNRHLGAANMSNVHEWLVHRFPALADYMPSQEQLLQQVGTAAKTAGSFLVSFASRMTAMTAVFLLNLFVMLYAMFFFFKDGHKILERILYYLPLSDEDETLMLARFTSITRATVKGTLVIGIIQGALSGVAFWVAGIDGAALWGTVMTILSIIPGIGAPLVWVPAVILLFVNGQYPDGNLAAGVVRSCSRYDRQFPAASACRPGCEDAGPSYSDRHARRIVPLRSDRVHCRTDHLWIVSDCVGHLRCHLQGSPAAGNKLRCAGSGSFGNRLARTFESLALVGVRIGKSCVALINVPGST